MPRWPGGEAEIEQLTAEGRLEPVTGAGSDAGPLLEQAVLLQKLNPGTTQRPQRLSGDRRSRLRSAPFAKGDIAWPQPR